MIISLRADTSAKGMHTESSATELIEKKPLRLNHIDVSALDIDMREQSPLLVGDENSNGLYSPHDKIVTNRYTLVTGSAKKSF